MSVVRRIVLVTVALAASACLLRSQMSEALVTRGDMLAYWGQNAAARVAYAKALAFDADNGPAADRLVFSAATTGDAGSLLWGVRVATSYLAKHRGDAMLTSDRAFCYQHSGELGLAAADFRRSGTIARDPRLLMFAALDERRLHHAALSHQLLRQAVALDAGFTPAVRALKVRER